MAIEINNLEKITETRYSLNSYSFLEFVLSLEYYIKQGFSIEQTNEGMPTRFVGSYSCILVKENESKVTEVQPKKAGRPSKA